MNLQKLTLNHLFVFIGILIAFGLVVFLGRISLEAIQKSQTIDESLATSSAPALNLPSLKKAKEIILNVVNPNVVTTTVVNPQPTTAPTPTPTPTPKNSNSELLTQLKKVEIINATDIEGAAQQVASLFAAAPNVSIDVKNGESDIDGTSLLYKNEYKELVATWQTALNGLDWNVGRVETKAESDTYDVTIILAK